MARIVLRWCEICGAQWDGPASDPCNCIAAPVEPFAAGEVVASAELAATRTDLAAVVAIVHRAGGVATTLLQMARSSSPWNPTNNQGRP
jgi:hypothetical protein